MKYYLLFTRYPFFILFCIYTITAQAIDAKAIEQQADSSINRLYQTLNSMPKCSMPERINWFSKHFLATKYVLGALGEGDNAAYDQFPRYRIDGFDCDTYVNTVIALSLANSVQSFQRCINLMRYKDGKVDYLYRNHFTSVDWNINNQKRGVLMDITRKIHNQKNESVAKIAHAIIDKPSWYRHKSVNTIRLTHRNSVLQKERLKELKARGAQSTVTGSSLPYLPFSALFLKNRQANLYLFAQIPDGAVIEVVRPNWDLRQQIGTALNVSHLGFAIWNKGVLYFREASSEYNKVVDVPLIKYLEQARKSPTIKGINIQVVLVNRPGDDNCSERNAH